MPDDHGFESVAKRRDYHAECANENLRQVSIAYPQTGADRGHARACSRQSTASKSANKTVYELGEHFSEPVFDRTSLVTRDHALRVIVARG